MKEVKKPADVPAGHHFAVIEYVEEKAHDGWDEKEGGGFYKMKVARHYVTTDRKEWEARIAKLEEPPTRYYDKKKEYVAFEVKALAKVERKVSVKVG